MVGGRTEIRAEEEVCEGGNGNNTNPPTRTDKECGDVVRTVRMEVG